MKHNKNLCIQGFIINELKHTYIYFTKLVRYYFLNLQLIFSRVKVKLRCYYALLIQFNLEESITSVTAKVIIEKFHGEVSLMEQDTIENVS